MCQTSENNKRIAKNTLFLYRRMLLMTNSSKELSRDSNFELLRIIDILFITFHHLLINGINLCGYNDEFCLNVDSSIAVFANSLIVGGKYFFTYFRLVWN